MTAEAETALIRTCAGCGRKKIDCPCWAAGAGDEARQLREGFDKDQLALMDYIRALLGHGRHPVPTLVTALRIEFSTESFGFWRRLRVAWHVLVGVKE